MRVVTSRELKRALGSRLRASLRVCYGVSPPDLDAILSRQFDQGPAGRWRWRLGEGGLWLRHFERQPADTWRDHPGGCRLCGTRVWERRSGELCGPCDSAWRALRPGARARRALRWEESKRKLAWERELRKSREYRG